MKLAIEDLSFDRTPLRSPFRFGASTMTDLRSLTVQMAVSERSRTGRGIGSMTLGNAWSWPEAHHTVSEAAMETLARQLARTFDGLELGDSVIDASLELKRVALDARRDMELAADTEMPALCALVSFSGFDIALFDAWGRMHGRNTFELIRASEMETEALAKASGTNESWVREVLTPLPAQYLDVFHAVGGLDPLASADVKEPVADGLPEHLQDWVVRDGVRCFKIKLRGDDPQWDYERIVDVNRTCQPVLAGREPVFSLDFNEQCPSGAVGAELLGRLAREQSALFSGIEFCEQPISRTLRGVPDEDIHAMARLLPVCLDEGLVDLAALDAGIAAGYNGICLKACKGIGFSLVAAAAARRRGLFVCFQDLTCTGRAYLASIALAARVGVPGLEANGRQFCPEASAEFARTHGDLFRVIGGTIATGSLTGPGVS